MKIYLDVSCLSRPFDDQWQERIRIEAEAVALVLEKCASGGWQHVSSEMAAIEIAANPDPDKQRKVRALLPAKMHILSLDEAVFGRAKIIEGLGFHAADAVHVAAAEALGADVVLTCDDRLLATARRSRNSLTVTIANPVVWLQEHGNAENP